MTVSTGAPDGVQGADGVEDVLVGGPVEVLGPQALLADRADGVARQQHGAEHGLLGLEVVRWHAPAARPALVAVASTIAPFHQATTISG